MANDDLGANQFTFAGDRTQISYETQTPIPSQGPLLRYEGSEGDDTFTGDQITRLDSALGNLVTVVTPRSPVTFGTIAIRTTSRGSISTPGAELTYDVLPLLGQANQVFLP